MDHQNLLTLLLCIVYRASVLGIQVNRESIISELENTTISNTSATNPEYHRIANITTLIHEIMGTSDTIPYDPVHFQNKISSILGADDHWEETITDSITDTTEKETIARYAKDVESLRFKQKQDKLTVIVSDAAYALKQGRVSNDEMMAYAKTHLLNVEEVITEFSGEDEAIVTRASTRDKKSMTEVYVNVEAELEGDLVYKLPFADINEGLSGGLRLADTMMLAALQHHYKSGMAMQIATGIPQINDPIQREGKGKPTVCRVSFEDSLENNFLFMYKEMYHNKYKKILPTTVVTPEKRSAAVIKKLTARGWEVDFLRANPSGWGYRDIINYVEKLEKDEDLDVQVLVIDYLLLVPSVGCITSGPMGTDKRDMLRRMRNWGSARKTAIVTPQQLNTTAKAKQREDIAPKDFLQNIKGCGMTADSSQLDQELDISMLLHRVKHNGVMYLNCVIDKHRHPTVVPESKKSTYIPFDKNMMPLLADEITGEKKSVRKLPSLSEGGHY